MKQDTQKGRKPALPGDKAGRHDLFSSYPKEADMRIESRIIVRKINAIHNLSNNLGSRFSPEKGII